MDWHPGRTPEDWQTWLIIPTHKGDRSECTNNQDLSAFLEKCMLCAFAFEKRKKSWMEGAVFILIMTLNQIFTFQQFEKSWEYA